MTSRTDKPSPSSPAEQWHRVGGLLYTLEQDGWRRGEPVMRNRLMVRVETGPGATAEEADALTDRLQSFLSEASPSSPGTALLPVELFVSFADNGNIRIWKTAEFPSSTRFVISLPPAAGGAPSVEEADLAEAAVAVLEAHEAFVASRTGVLLTETEEESVAAYQLANAEAMRRGLARLALFPAPPQPTAAGVEDHVSRAVPGSAEGWRPTAEDAAHVRGALLHAKTRVEQLIGPGPLLCHLTTALAKCPAPSAPAQAEGEAVVSLQRRINRETSRRQPRALDHSDRLHRAITVNCPPEVVNHPDKGKRDGRCNRTACQRPLAGEPQFYMDGSFTGGPRLYYCAQCEYDFTSWDRRSGDRIRCKPDEGNGIRALGKLIELQAGESNDL